MTANATESVLTYAEVIDLTLSNMKKRRDNFHQLKWLHWNEWKYFNVYLRELQENFLRYLRGFREGTVFEHLPVLAHDNLKKIF